ncbi:PAS domain S-box protein [Aurantimonas sp. MSK8Z-1]|uniref:PAS domain S-box protein n=1 Tax=Mangrovibrevibacter kandeliae TaxID=2968473 RepID=UPI00211838D9|nr:PAS domain S-box protein [Aurantimonas sp. MSK8Z-1]MCW4116042.1 PAS domain S-box protein [Aurantimonas sp. MSK8Z-1]
MTSIEDRLQEVLAENARLRDRLELAEARLRAPALDAPEQSPAPAAADDYRSVLDSATDYAIVATDLAGDITLWSEGARLIFGWDAAEMLGRSADTLSAPEDRATGQCEHERQRAILSGRAAMDRWFVRRNGTRFWASGSQVVQQDRASSRTGLIIVLRDLTLQHFVEQSLETSSQVLEENEQRLRASLRAGRMVVWEYDILARQLSPSPELALLLGFPADHRPDLDEIRAGYLPGESERLSETVRAALRRGERFFEHELRYVRPDGAISGLQARGEVFLDADGRPVRVVGVLQDVTDRLLTQDRLRRNEEEMRAITNALPVFIARVDANGIYEYVNENYEVWYGLKAAAMVGRHMREVIGEALYEARLEHFAKAFAGEAVVFDAAQTDPWRGRKQVLETHYIPRRRPDGRAEGFFILAIDVTGRKRAEDDLRLVTHELQHRVKNTLAMVQAIASQTFRQASDVASARTAFEARLAALADVYDSLVHHNWRGAPIHTVVEGALAPHGLGSGRFRIDGPELALGARHTLALSLALHELATNAAKYGALREESGRVDVIWRVDGRSEEARFHFKWQESGGPPVTAPSTFGFGTRMIERTLGGYFDGQAVFSYDTGGVCLKLEAPWPDAARNA